MTSLPPASAATRGLARHFANSGDELFEYALCDIDPGDIVGIWKHNEESQQD
jgi:hypothetical protein